MKRLYSALASFSEESEAIIKRARLLISSLSSSTEIDQNTPNNSSDSQNENNTCERLEDVITGISNSEDEQNSFTDDPESTEPELIDLTENEPISTKLEHQSSTDIDECPICLEALSDLQSINIYLIITPCHHVMCTSCSHQLLSISSQCPLCRQIIHSTSLIPYCILT